MTVLSQKTKITMRLGEWKPRNKLEGEAPPVTFSHLKDGQVYKTDWATPHRAGATDANKLKSRGV